MTALLHNVPKTPARKSRSFEILSMDQFFQINEEVLKIGLLFGIDQIFLRILQPNWPFPIILIQILNRILVPGNFYFLQLEL